MPPTVGRRPAQPPLVFAPTARTPTAVEPGTARRRLVIILAVSAQPVAVLFIGVLHPVADAEDPYAIVARTVTATPAGSYLAITQPAADINAEVVAEGARRYDENVNKS